jgi:hypothetical protein
MKKNEIIKLTIFYLIALPIMVLALFYAVGQGLKGGIEAHERSHCLYLQEQAEEYRNYDGYYILQSDKDMCDRYNININAPIR